MSQSSSVAVPPLTYRAFRINEAHKYAQDAGRSMLSYAVEAGKELIAVKASLKHGEFQGWWHYRNLTAKTEDVDQSVADLRVQLDRMDTEDWADVMPDLKTALEQVEADQQDAHDASAR